jgi:hypothetical protein
MKPAALTARAGFVCSAQSHAPDGRRYEFDADFHRIEEDAT